MTIDGTTMSGLSLAAVGRNFIVALMDATSWGFCDYSRGSSIDGGGDEVTIGWTSPELGSHLPLLQESYQEDWLDGLPLGPRGLLLTFSYKYRFSAGISYWYFNSSPR